MLFNQVWFFRSLQQIVILDQAKFIKQLYIHFTLQLFIHIKTCLPNVVLFNYARIITALKTFLLFIWLYYCTLNTCKIKLIYFYVKGKGPGMKTTVQSLKAFLLSIWLYDCTWITCKLKSVYFDMSKWKGHEWRRSIQKYGKTLQDTTRTNFSMTIIQMESRQKTRKQFKWALKWRYKVWRITNWNKTILSEFGHIDLTKYL